MLVSVHDSWPLIKLEVADGFYSPYCAAVRYVIDHFAAVVLLSFVVVSVAHAGFWGDIISGEIGGMGVWITSSPAAATRIAGHTRAADILFRGGDLSAA